MRRSYRLITLAAIMAVLMSAMSFGAELVMHTKHTLYIGMNDGDTGEQVYSMAEARKIFNEIAIKYVDGYTLYEADGFWREGENVSSEHTLVCVIDGASDEAVKGIMDEALKAFNQHSILLEFSETNSLFYDGKTE